MKKPFLAALFMSCFAFALAAIALFLIYTSTAEEVQSLRDQQQDINQQIDKARLKQVQSPDDKRLALKLEKLNMERVLLPLPWALEIEMVENGPISFILSVFGSAEARKEKLRNLILDQAAKTDLNGCPQEFRRLFKIYASPAGFGSESLQNLHDFAEKYSGSDEFGPPDVTQTE